MIFRRRFWFSLLRRSGRPLVVGVHAEAAVAPHHRALERSRGERRGVREGPHLCLKGPTGKVRGQRWPPMHSIKSI